MTEKNKPFTVRSIAEAIKVLEANNIPPAICSECGNGFYLMMPGRAMFGGGTMVKDFCCDECKAVILARHKR